MTDENSALSDLPSTLVFDHLVGLSFDETIRPSAHERLAREGERARVQALPQILDAGPASEADFTPLETIGMGGLGTVERGHQRSVGRDVAIKRVRDPSVPGAAAMLLDEGHVMGLLEHPSIVPVLALGRDGGGHPVLVMKRVDGVTWRTLLRNPEHEAWGHIAGDRLEFHLRVLAQVADVAHYAHIRGWLHRDIKPDNVMVSPRGDVYLIDWGLAVRIPVDVDEDAQLVGTPGCMAPEMLRGIGPWLSPQTDVYLLGAALHEVLTGTIRHQGATLRAVLASAWLSDPIDYPASTPEELASLANEATRSRPEERLASAEAFKQRIEVFLRHRQALELVEDVRVLSGGLRAIAPGEAVADEVEALQCFDGCVAGLRRSLELWPTNAGAVGLLSDVLAWRVRHALANGDVLSAQSALADLPRADPQLEEELTQASARIRQERTRLARLSDIGRLHDPGPLASMRARTARASGLVGGGAMIALGAAAHAGVVPLSRSVLMVALCAALGVVVVVAVRAREHEGVTDRTGPQEMGWVVGGALALTILGAFIGLSPGQTLAVLPVFAGACAGLLARGLGRARWGLVALCAVSASLAPTALRRDPAFLLYLMGLTTLAAHFMLAWMWDRLAGERGRRPRRGATPAA